MGKPFLYLFFIGVILLDFLNSIKVKIPSPISNMITLNHMHIIIKELYNCLSRNIDGDLVELGCNLGSTSIIIQTCLLEFNSHKNFHLYDSFEGLPSKTLEDIPIENSSLSYNEGDLKTSKEILINNFKQRGIKLPFIHVGWFKEIPAVEYPDKICFSFLDGDFYSSIMDSLNIVYSKMSSGGVILIHDYGWPPLPGVKSAVTDFLSDKPEKVLEEDYIAKIYKE